MKDSKQECCARSEAPARHLLAARARQIRQLRDDLAGLTEVARLSGALMALLALSCAGDPEAEGAIGREMAADGALAVRVSKVALREALTMWRADIEQYDDSYRILFQKSETAT